MHWTRLRAADVVGSEAGFVRRNFLRLENAACAVCTTSQAQRHTPRSQFRELCSTAMVSCCTVSILIGDTVTQGLATDEIGALCRRTYRLPFALRSDLQTKTKLIFEALASDGKKTLALMYSWHQVSLEIVCKDDLTSICSDLRGTQASTVPILLINVHGVLAIDLEADKEVHGAGDTRTFGGRFLDCGRLLTVESDFWELLPRLWQQHISS
jgi:hypothetical protein